MRNRFIAIAISVLAACGVKPNPNVCCATEAQCEALDIHELRPCGPGQACNAGKCEASQCDVSADCPAENPICMDNLCIGSCTTDDQCADTGRPLCEGGTCIGCRSALDCPSSAAICDQQEHACRGCVSDDECTSGVCIEFEGTCATPNQLIFVKSSGTDTGTCTASAPCATLTYAVQQVMPSRNVVRVVGGALGAQTTVTTSAPVIFDGSPTTLVRPQSGPLFNVTFGTTTLEGFTIKSFAPTMDTISVAGGTLRMTKVDVTDALIGANSGTLELKAVRLTGADVGLVKCTSGTASISGSEFHHASLYSTNCQLSLQRNVFDGMDELINVMGGKMTVENNLFVQSSEFADSTYFAGALGGSVVRFNTIVNTSGVVGSGVAMNCDGTQDVSNNIFAYRSTVPMSGPGGTPCPARYSLFDSAAQPANRAGEGNRAADFALIFASANAKDFHLAMESPAEGVAQPNTLNVDLENNPRPRPAGTNPDVGCYEAP